MAKAKTTRSKPLQILDGIRAYMAPVNATECQYVAVDDGDNSGVLIWVPIGSQHVKSVTPGSSRTPGKWANAANLGKGLKVKLQDRGWTIFGLRVGSTATAEETAELFGKAEPEAKATAEQNTLS
tara:strand:+ start:99 stop:473 length:375 start_codon:yes stop_codon:yes gene_type:complete